MLVPNKPVKGKINNGKFMKIISMNCGPGLTWLVSSVGRALHQYRKGHIYIILIIAVINTPWIHDRCCWEMTRGHSGVQNE